MISNKTILAVIPIKTQSRGFYEKSLRITCGRPLFHWSLLAAVKSKYIDLIIISSNNDKIKESNDLFSVKKENDLKSNKYKVPIYLERPNDLFCEDEKIDESLLYSINKLKETGFHSDIVVTLNPLYPIRNNNLLDRCIERMLLEKSDSLITALQLPKAFWQLNKDKTSIKNYKENDFIYIENGNISIVNTNILEKYKTRIEGKVSTFITTKHQNIKIDSDDDFKMIDRFFEDSLPV